MDDPQTDPQPGAALAAGGALDDRIIDLMIYLCEVLPPEALD